MEAPAAINVVAACQHAGVWRGFFRSKPPPATGAYANLAPCVHENAHSSSAERQEEVINRGVNVTRRRGRPRFEATNEQRRTVEIWSGWGSRRRISAVSCGTAGIGRSAKTRCENILNRRSRGGPQK